MVANLSEFVPGCHYLDPMCGDIVTVVEVAPMTGIYAQSRTVSGAGPSNNNNGPSASGAVPEAAAS